jgi:glyoxylase-like metal-dependent hydrolase (beta-lactamase superfamily II)
MVTVTFMIRSYDYGDVRYFSMGKPLFGRVFYCTGVYYIDGLIVDTGPPNLAGEVRQLFGDLDIRQAVVTHAHEDHCGNGRLLEEVLGITALAPEKALPLLGRTFWNLELYRRVLWGTPPPFAAKPLGEWLETKTYRFQVVPTPGHSHDHVVLFEPERRWLFTGDLYLSPKLRVLRSDENLPDLIDSLRRVIKLEPEVIFCQHRGLVQNATEMLHRKLQHLLEICGRIDALQLRGLTESEIAGSLPGSDFLWRLGTRNHFSKLHFVRSWLRDRVT